MSSLQGKETGFQKSGVISPPRSGVHFYKREPGFYRRPPVSCPSTSLDGRTSGEEFSPVNILAFNGSPRPGGNTELLLEGALKPLREAGNKISVFKLNIMRIIPCQDCGGCVKTGLCIHTDDMSKIYVALREAERIILASPIFFYSLSAQTKAMIDRCQSFWCEKYLLKKSIPAGPRGRKGLLLLVGGMKKEDGRHTAEVVAKGFFRTVSVPEHETLFYGGVDAIGDILSHPTALHDAHEAGLRLGCSPTTP